jgi:hypothetical protein
MPRESPSVVYYVDVIVAIFLLIVSVLTIIMGVIISTERELSGYTFFTVSGWLIIFLGFAGIIYGIKRLIDDIAKGMQPSK